MKLPIRLENAITKLYTAFHENRLNGVDCRACAVGNICNNSPEWWYGENNNHFMDRDIPIKVQQKVGYSDLELCTIEYLFLFGKRKKTDITHFDNTLVDKETQFKGLCAVVEYLCELDNIPNVMDYTKLFETENEKPKYQLNTI